ncbi:hypothetical protein VTJ04DRAFT_1738 [Mycothermus thermophilus]|uniref:uncharacterized protein n=1 Tax=Humicola insolens TaxID=85995 RepID=UPI003742965E
MVSRFKSLTSWRTWKGTGWMPSSATSHGCAIINNDDETSRLTSAESAAGAPKWHPLQLQTATQSRTRQTRSATAWHSLGALVGTALPKLAQTQVATPQQLEMVDAMAGRQTDRQCASRIAVEPAPSPESFCTQRRASSLLKLSAAATRRGSAGGSRLPTRVQPNDGKVAGALRPEKKHSQVPGGVDVSRRRAEMEP